MTVPPLNNTPLSQTHVQTSVNVQHSSTTSGLSSVEDSLSLIREGGKGCLESFFAQLLYPFTAGFEAIKNFFSSIFGSEQKKMSPDEKRYAFINDHLRALTPASQQKCVDKFYHIKDPLLKLETFKLIQNCNQISNQVIKTFFGNLSIDVQDHIKRHIWEANSYNDNGMGLAYGNYMIYWFPKHENVSRAVDQCIAEAKRTAHHCKFLW